MRTSSRAVELGGRRAVTRAVRAAHLEQVGEVAGEVDRHRQVDGEIAVIAHAEALVQRVAP